jgi:hypothetical protein
MKVGHPLAMLDPRRPTLLRTPVKKGKVTEAKIEQEINQEIKEEVKARARHAQGYLPRSFQRRQRLASVSDLFRPRCLLANVSGRLPYAQQRSWKNL